MAKAYEIHIWKKAPFLRLLMPVIVGIVLEFYLQFQLSYIIVSSISFSLAFLLFKILPEDYRFRLRYFQGIIITLFLVVFGLFITWQKDIRNHKNWYGKNYNDSSFFIATINEPPVEKAKSYKALASIESVINNDSQRIAKGKLIIYFAKDSTSKQLKYGDKIVIGKVLQPIKNSGNPGGFNYAQYLSFQQIYYQCYLKKQDWILLKGNNATAFKTALYNTRNYALKTIDKYIIGNNESALAKALLIGYRVDLDKDLVQAYSNAGVVHLIAISGLHLALIYGLLLWVTSKIPYLKKAKMPRLIVILFCLWFFSFLTGAPPSVMRAAVMFSFISIGTVFNKNSSIYNSLCCSAFLLLCFDPFILWNVGFQLSYSAVLGIVILQKHIYNWFSFKNKILDYTWNMASVSIAAQVFTIPICFYYFHQLPLLFLLANLIAIPLATIALWGCIGLIILSPVALLSVYFGKLVTVFLWLMNHSVLLINSLPFVLWNDIFISILSTILLYPIFILFIYWLIKKNIFAFKIALISTLAFLFIISFNKWQSHHQKKMIVYNIPQHRAIDFIDGNKYYPVADSSLKEDKLLQSFHLKPARISLLANNRSDSFKDLFSENNFFRFYEKKIMIIDTAVFYAPLAEKIALDYIIISGNAKIKIASLAQTFTCNQFICDASNSLWKIEQWKKECEELHLHFHSVSEQGAFVTDL
ncbi:MAG: competence protein ComEC family protein [Bacteroidota bacterium]|nr:competence protein ComEC family protein [Bacteroidota bacterium]